MNKLLVIMLFSIVSGGSFAQTPKGKVSLIRTYLPDGEEEVYMTIDSIKYGLYIYYDSLGRRVVESCYVNGQETGPFIFYHQNGNIAQKSYLINGKLHGKSIIYYQDGTIQRISQWNMDHRDGIEETYIEDGRLDKRLLYRNDTLLYIIEDHHYLPLPPTVEPLYKD